MIRRWAADGPAEDAALLGRLHSDERREVLVALSDRYGNRLYGLGLRLLGDRAAVDLQRRAAARPVRAPSDDHAEDPP